MRENLVGQKFGMLTIIEEVPKEKRKNKDGRREWYCQCDCGNITQVRTDHLKDGRIKSCGCLAGKGDLIGQRFGKLTVIKEVPKEERHTKDGRREWYCQCDCGNITQATTKNLKKGDTKSCGCLRSKGEQKINQLLFDNNINFTSEFWFDDLNSEKGNPLRFDFAIINDDKSIKCLIEYQGGQHYQNVVYLNSDITQIHDQMKRDYCVKNNVPLIEIPYTDYDKLDWNYLKEKINTLT